MELIIQEIDQQYCNCNFDENINNLEPRSMHSIKVHDLMHDCISELRKAKIRTNILVYLHI